MILDIFIIVRVLNILYSWLEHNIIDNILAFTKVFGNMIVLISAVIFLLILAYITIKYLKKLPRFYALQVTDIFGNNITLDGIRTKFATYDVAKSYSEFYGKIFKNQYKFHIIGSNQRYNLGFLDVISLPHKVFKKMKYTHNQYSAKG